MKVVVSGIGVVSALGIGVEQNYTALRNGKSGLTDVTLFQTRHQVPVGEVKKTNDEIKQLLGLPSNKIYSRTSLLGMLAAHEALDDAQLPKGLRIGLISSTSVGGMDLTERFYRDYMKNINEGDLQLVAHHDSADSTLAIADFCGITTFATTISTACSSGANAIMLGARMIKAGMLDAVVAGGTDSLCQFTMNGFDSLKILSASQCCPFDNERSGLNLGEGAGYIVLQREDLNNKEPYAELLGYANANDATHQTASSENGEGDYRSMWQAIQVAHLTPQDIDYINVHGTGTGNNDASEGMAMTRIFGEDIPPFSSTKPFTGHTLAAAGGIEAVFSILSIQHGAIFPNLNFKTPMANNPLFPHTHYSEGNAINVVMSNSFGFGGNCSTLIFGK